LDFSSALVDFTSKNSNIFLSLANLTRVFKKSLASHAKEIY
jgi:hypothetical protein